MNRILYIIGPTATGKTDIALELAHKYNGELISADSRQVYTGMTIGSGKDIPPDAVKSMSTLKVSGEKIFYYKTATTRIWGYDVVSPRQDFSVALFKQMADQVIADIHARDKLPIVVGGTGFYLQSIETPPESLTIPINQSLRDKVASFTVVELQQYLKKINTREFKALNSSDSKNPRRLIRRIEIASFNQAHKDREKVAYNHYKSLWIGIDAPMPIVADRIKKRVAKRLVMGFEQECQELVMKGFLRSDQKSTTATGYLQWLEYRDHKISREEFVAKWITAEMQYAKRQKTWFKKVTNCQWFDACEPGSRSAIVELVENW